ncbi:hypothetical protein ATO13_22476 [Stappia sp. 22II-S9-Z10]|nr:hypothetical protein ATO13_22476 [Stappia sp. 22II-S9-Z10]
MIERPECEQVQMAHDALMAVAMLFFEHGSDFDSFVATAGIAITHAEACRVGSEINRERIAERSGHGL